MAFLAVLPAIIILTVIVAAVSVSIGVLVSKLTSKGD